MTTRTQKFVARNRNPRVQIAYPVELYGAQRDIQLPFVIGVLADLSGSSEEPLRPVAMRKFLDIDVDTFDSCMAGVRPRALLKVPDVLDSGGELTVDISFECLADFDPSEVAGKVAPLKNLVDRRTRLVGLLTYVDGKAGAEDLLLKLLVDRPALDALAADTGTPDAGRRPDSTAQPAVSFADGENVFDAMRREFRPRSPEAASALASALCELARAALASPDKPHLDAIGTIDRMVASIDARISHQLGLIFHHAEFQRLESAWRGLHYLVSNTETSDALKIRFMNVSKAELGKTLRRHKGTGWDQSPLFKRLCEDEYGAFGGEPFGCVVGDYVFDHSAPDIETLGELGKICAAAHTPFLAGAAMSFINAEPSSAGFAFGRTAVGRLVIPEYAAWRGLRHADESRYIALALPRFLARLPYGQANRPVPDFDFEEAGAEVRSTDQVWCNAAYAMAVCIGRAFSLYGWCARIQGIESGGAVEGLPACQVTAATGESLSVGPVEVTITDRLEADLSRQGFMTLSHRRGSDFAAFVSAPSIHQHLAADADAAHEAARPASGLPHLLACCRFVQHMKCLVRDQVGTFKEREGLERWLQQWVQDYVDPDPTHVSEELRARRPLASAEVLVAEVEGNPGYYAARFFLRPVYQLEAMPVSMRIVSRLPSVKASQ